MKHRFFKGSQLAQGLIGSIKRFRQRFREYVDLCLTSGFIPKSVRPLQLVGKFLANIWVFVQVGRIKIEGKENLVAPGRIIFCPNHSSMFDAPVIFAIMKRMPRYMTAYEEMRGLWGLKAIFMGAFGCFAVDRSQGKTVIEPAIKVLEQGEALVIFPEGKISNSGTYLPFKKGSAYIAIGAHERLNGKDKVGIVPIHICYGKRHEESAGGPYGAMGFKWRGGVTITIGKPVYINEIVPMTADKVTEDVRMAIVNQACATTSLPKDDVR
ncbi:MAG: 1-acyl-sn-glycerol-3-phosphate acyltransferase [Candidatus Obscuribacterales bacterium]|nr:1-acyl-sn-glycerol-3-phosphate acyltransferase [Candidatus Obscuribacterales bacterium]